MLLPNLHLLNYILPIIPILAKDFFTRPKVQEEVTPTYPGQIGLGGALADNLMKVLSARFGGQGMRPSTYRGLSSVTNFQPYEQTQGTSPLPTINFGPIGDAIQRAIMMQRNGGPERDRGMKELTPSNGGPRSSRRPGGPGEDIGDTSGDDFASAHTSPGEYGDADSIANEISRQLDRGVRAE